MRTLAGLLVVSCMACSGDDDSDDAAPYNAERSQQTCATAPTGTWKVDVVGTPQAPDNPSCLLHNLVPDFWMFGAQGEQSETDVRVDGLCVYFNSLNDVDLSVSASGPGEYTGDLLVTGSQSNGFCSLRAQVRLTLPH